MKEQMKTSEQAAPSDADEQTPNDIVWAAYEQDLPRARLTVHSSHFNTSAPVWFERGYHAALSQTMQPAGQEQSGAVADDAARYRNLRDNSHPLGGRFEITEGNPPTHLYGELLDAALKTAQTVQKE